MKVLMITSEWPSIKNPHAVPFLVQQVKFLKDKDVDVDIYAFRGRKNPINYFKAWLSLQKLYQKGKFDLVHAQFGQSAILAWPKKLPLVVTFRGSDLEGYVNDRGKHSLMSSCLKTISRYMAKKADRVVVVSRSLLKHLPNEKNTHIIPSGINFDLFKPMERELCRKKLGWDLKAKYILFAGDSKRAVKNFPLAVASVNLLSSTYKVHLIVMPRIAHSQVPLYLNASNCLLLTSFHEGSPNIVKEALACNVPVVSVNVGDVQERIGGVKGNYVCSTRMPEEIASKLEMVLNSSHEINNRINIDDLNEKVTTQRLIDLYTELKSTSTSFCNRKENIPEEEYYDHQKL